MVYGLRLKSDGTAGYADVVHCLAQRILEKQKLEIFFKVTINIFNFSGKQQQSENADPEQVKAVEAAKEKPVTATAEADDKDESDDDENAPEAGDKKKKKRKRNKKKGGSSNENLGIGTTPGKAGSQFGQTSPPSIPIVELFKDGKYPEGEIQKYPVDERTAKDRFTSEEKKAIDAAHSEIYNEVRLAAEAHRETRQYMVRKWSSQ